MAQIETISQGFNKARPVNSTDASFPARVPTQTEPSGTGVIELAGNIGIGTRGSFVQNGIVVVPYATGAAMNTFGVRLIGWRVLGEADRTTQLWIPVVLTEVICTLGTSSGVAGFIIGSAELFADTLVLVTGTNGVDVDLVSPTGNLISHFASDLKGSQKAELTFNTQGSVTNMNALWALL